MDNPYCQSSLSINILFFFPCSRTKNSALICQMPIVKSPLESFGFFSSFPMLPSWTFLPVKDCEVLLLSDSQGSCSGSSSILEPKNLGALWRTGPCSLLNQLNCSMDEAGVTQQWQNGGSHTVNYLPAVILFIQRRVFIAPTVL